MPLNLSWRPNMRFYSTSLQGSKLFSVKDLTTHDMLLQSRFIYQPAAGIVHWLPLGLRTYKKLQNVIRKRMDQAGGLEMELSSLSSKHLWERTKRWDNNELFKFKDSKDRDYCLVPTCEEEITNLVGDLCSSYKDLPLLVYQISRKYRDELRPRGGLLRGREFLMKDAYSFDLTKEDGLKSYDNVNEAYRRIFQDLKLPVTVANADSGSIGGDLSLEYHLIHESGEDILFRCNSCQTVSNVEKCQSLPDKQFKGVQEAECQYFINKDRNTLIIMYYPKGRKLNPQYVKDEIPDIDFSIDEEMALTLFKNESEESSSFLVKEIIRVIDPRVTSNTNMPDLKVLYHRNSMFTFTDIPIVEAIAGERCYECEKGTLSEHTAIEVGHTFYLDKKYSSPLDCTVVNEQNEQTTVYMGCYGIGVSRLIAAIAQTSRDEVGLTWPQIIAPYQITLLSNKTSSKKNLDTVTEILSSFDVQVDNRDGKFSMGHKLKQSKVAGIPLQIIVGKHFPLIEIEVRTPIQHSQELKDLYKRKTWDWEIQESPQTAGCSEKHLVHLTGLAQVVDVLLECL
ncbi:Putative tRNA synthetase [Komagataella phaffii CBS 7435]|uniref:proline--tRNA ligase n=2 Tax=Komagataella phaffii TaxID=460519 RepID=C4R2I4_KOMPG|nr:uncharacterized protein PAS_chr2-2_0209 [Komagataella phaffii GS115]AOA62343.1 GQ67_01126T0 [Komagataella phaffii]CAH2447738.1 Putative tRNA synthetase [Komagataella phaffii CBS 7435]AOA67806.1 GQ68_00263T0 [Komagataella phaffii GS115]CAY69708.1 Protein with similarity to tRNA synthetases [Komagataella phaffii GS115]CCA37916.1 Putative tRNA synthetase [Komagataella phaffii CBS 7435]